MKICTKCKQNLDLIWFVRDRSTSDGFHPWCKKCRRQHKDNHAEEIRVSNARYYQSHKKERNKYSENKRRTDLNYRLRAILRTRMNMALRGNQKSGSAVKDLGCSISELKERLESNFQPGMTWENYGKYPGWQIDHIVELYKFDLSDREQFLKACHCTNLQPLWARDNIVKSNSINTTLVGYINAGSKNPDRKESEDS